MRICDATDEDIAASTDDQLSATLEALLGWRVAVCEGIARIERLMRDHPYPSERPIPNWECRRRKPIN